MAHSKHVSKTGMGAHRRQVGPGSACPGGVTSSNRQTVEVPTNAVKQGRRVHVSIRGLGCILPLKEIFLNSFSNHLLFKSDWWSQFRSIGNYKRNQKPTTTTEKQTVVCERLNQPKPGLPLTSALEQCGASCPHQWPQEGHTNKHRALVPLWIRGEAVCLNQEQKSETRFMQTLTYSEDGNTKKAKIRGGRLFS